MKKLLLSTIVLALFIACSTSRQMEKAVGVGNYDQAISDAIGKLRINKDNKGKEDIIILLEEAFYKATERDLSNIDYLKRDQNPENYIRIYDAYVNLDNRQERIKPLLPLYAKGKVVNFKFNNYNSQIISYKNEASEQIYGNATALLNSNNKLDYRTAYQALRDIEDINPNYKDVRQLMETAHQKGTDFVLVDMVNDSGKIIPVRLENDLLNFSSYGLNNFWAVYHNTPEDKINYDYNMRVNLRDINISPEQIKERQIIKEKEIADGKKILLDERGNTVKDSLGNNIEIDNLKTVRCEYYEFTQFKATQVTGNVEYVNLNTKQLVDAFPVTSEFVFQHIYATSRGDRRALETTLIPFLERRAVPFPTEEQMIYDSGEDLKLQLKNIINSYTLN
jgi:tetratricopeptide (TPR) repeat protein